MADEITRIIKLEVQSDKADRDIKKIGSDVESLGTKFDRIGGNITKFVGNIGKITLAGVAIGKIAGTIENVGSAVIKSSDQFHVLIGRFSALLGPGNDVVKLVNDIYAMAIKTGVPVEDLGNSFTRLAIAFGDLKPGNDVLRQMVTTFVDLGRLGGASAAETASTMVQLTQAISSGKLAGDELKSVLENSPLFAQRLAAVMNVNVGQLKSMGADGKIFASHIVEALRPTDELAKKLQSVPVTMEQSWNSVTAATGRMFVEVDKVGDFSGTLRVIFARISELIEHITKRLGDSAEETNGWKGLVAGVGAAFKVVAVAGATVYGVVAHLTDGLVRMANVAGAVKDLDFTRLAKALSVNDMISQFQATAQKNGQIIADLIRGTDSLGREQEKWSRKQRDEYDQFVKQIQERDKRIKELEDAAKKRAKSGKQTNEWDSWVESLDKLIKTTELVPQKIEFLKAVIDGATRKFGAGSAVVAELRKQLEQLEPPDAITATMRELDAAIDKLADGPKIIAALEKQLASLDAVGAKGSREWNVYFEARQRLIEAQDSTGLAKFTHELIEQQKQLELIPAKIDAVITAFGRGDIGVEVFRKSLDSLGEKTKEVGRSLGEELLDAGKSFTENFSNEIIDGLGKAEIKLDDFAASFLKMIAKTIMNYQIQQAIKSFSKSLESIGGSGFWGWVGSAFTGAGTSGGVSPAPPAPGSNVYTSAVMAASMPAPAPPAFGYTTPVSRSPGGSASPGFGGNVSVVVNNNAPVEVGVTERSNGNDRIIEMTIEQVVKQKFASGSMDRTMRSVYGLSRQPS